MNTKMKPFFLTTGYSDHFLITMLFSRNKKDWCSICQVVNKKEEETKPKSRNDKLVFKCEINYRCTDAQSHTCTIFVTNPKTIYQLWCVSMGARLMFFFHFLFFR